LSIAEQEALDIKLLIEALQERLPDRPPAEADQMKQPRPIEPLPWDGYEFIED
jgi:hypothetical protein